MMRHRGPQGDTIRFWRSPIGWIGFSAGDHGLIDIVLGRSREHAEEVLQKAHPCAMEGTHPAIERAIEQLEEYFAGKRRRFDLELDVRDISPFSLEILKNLALTEFGTSLTYGELAAKSGRQGAARAVGGVMAANRWPIVIPCHRVVGKDGTLTGYSGGKGLETKEWLLRFEKIERKRN